MEEEQAPENFPEKMPIIEDIMKDDEEADGGAGAKYSTSSEKQGEK